MNKTLRLFPLLLFAVLLSCKKDKIVNDDIVTNRILYFPPINNSTWETKTPESLNWDFTQLNSLYPYLESKNTKAFIILKDGKIVTEKYFGTFKADSNWYWASAGKTLTGFLVGIAQQENLLNINDKTSKYLGVGWTNAPLFKENLITLKNQLSMTTGLDDGYLNSDCTLPQCLVYKADAGTKWAYHNAPYTLLDKVIEAASGKSYNAYFQDKIRDKIGMNGLWIKSADANNVFYSNARSMARFGLLMLNKGKWESNVILNDTTYLNNQVNTSQNLNLSYGYLTWLNGKPSYMFPSISIVFNGGLIPNAPSDLYAALGKNDQKIYVVPSKKLVIIRMGNSAGNPSLASSNFDNELWAKLNFIMRD